jgi:hypothetical protein
VAEALVTVQEASSLLECSRETVHWLIKRGDLSPLVPPHAGKRPRRLFLLRSEVERLRGGAWRRQPERNK